MITLIYFFSIFLIPEQVEYYQNEPVVFTININADSAEAANALLYEKELLAYKKKSEQITDEEYNKQMKGLTVTDSLFSIKDDVNWKNKATIEMYDEVEKLWITPDNIHLLDSKNDTTAIEIKKNDYYYVDWGMDPENVKTLNTGPHKIRARLVFENRGNNNTDTLYTDVQTIEILSGNKDDNDAGFIKTLCIYYTRRGLFDKALELAERHSDISNNAYTNNILYGNIYELTGDYDNALKYFMEAKNVASDMSHQYSEYIDQKIQDLLEISPSSIDQFIILDDE